MTDNKIFKDRYGFECKIGDRVAWAAVRWGRPFILEGTITEFNNHPSMIEAIVKTQNNRTVKKYSNDLIKLTTCQKTK